MTLTTLQTAVNGELYKFWDKNVARLSDNKTTKAEALTLFGHYLRGRQGEEPDPVPDGQKSAVQKAAEEGFNS